MSTTSNFNTVRVLSKSEFNSFSSTSNDTLYFVEMDNTMFDGQWIPKTQVLSQVGTAGVISMDVSSYLPNDNYNYEVLIICSFGDNGTNYYRVYSDIIPQPTTVSLVCTKNGYYNGSYIAIPVGSGRVIYRWANAATSANGHYGIEALAYRRIGTNE